MTSTYIAYKQICLIEKEVVRTYANFEVYWSNQDYDLLRRMISHYSMFLVKMIIYFPCPYTANVNLSQLWIWFVIIVALATYNNKSFEPIEQHRV